MPLIDAEPYFAKRMEDPEFAEGYKFHRICIDQIDALYNSLNERRHELRLTKSKLAEQTGLPRKAIRDFFSNGIRNSSIETLVAIATALEMNVSSASQANRKERRNGKECR